MRALACAVLVAVAAAEARAQTKTQGQTQADAPPPAVQPFVRNWTRFEVWRYFEPPSGGGDPRTEHLGNRLLAGVRLRRGRADATVALQYVQFGGLPSDAIGPGALGTGALYFDHAGSRSSRQVYLKSAHVTLRTLGGSLAVQVGRMPYTSGAERASGVPKIEAVKRARIDSRLVGEFEWSLYQRAFDGARLDWSGRAAQVTASAFRPTQGGFEDAAGVGISRLGVYSGVVTTAPGALVPESELQVFAHAYDDDRQVAARPDNAGRPAAAVHVGVVTVGTHVVGARRSGAGELDWLAWAALQTGSWYEQDHRAVAWSLEAGYHWPDAPASPWLRAGLGRWSGDDDPGDGDHGTFFPMLPTVRRYSQSTLYSTANLRDAFVQAVLRPRANVTARLDVHALALAEAADGWYAGSGATQESGRIFGYTLRRSGGATRLAEIVEGSVDWRLTPHWSVNVYAARASRGPVVAASFAEGAATFLYVEHVVQF